jgi:cell division GTPase FtsZ
MVPAISILSEYGLPITVLYTLPTSSEGTVTKSNAIKGLDQLAQLAGGKLINGIVVIDNSRIEDIYSNVSLGGFYKVANFDIANIFNTFNTLSSLPTLFTAIDPTDFLRIMTSGNCTVFGKVSVPLSIEDGQVNLNEDDLAQTLLQSVNEGLLAKGFDIKETVRGGVYILGKASVLNQIPAETFSYAFASLNEELNKADIFRGVYNDERLNDQLQVYILLSGLGLPRERVNQLMEQAQQDLEVMESKEVDSKARMEVFQKSTLSEDDKYRQKKKQNSTFGKMMSRPRTRG